MAGRLRQELEVVGHMAPAIRKQRERSRLLLCSLLCFIQETPARGTVPLTFRLCLTTSVEMQRCASYAILNTTGLAVKTDHRGHLSNCLYRG